MPRSSLLILFLACGVGSLPLLAWPRGQVVGNLLIPSSSIERPGDIGFRMHTDHQIFLGPCAGLGPAGGMTPAQLWSFYGMPGTGGHDVIVIVDAYDYPTALSDFNTFSGHFGLPQESSTLVTAPTNTVFQVVYASGSQPGTDSTGGWPSEAALDIEWAHAMAPGAKIVLVEATDEYSSSLFSAVDLAATLADVRQISMSWGGSEFSGESSYDVHFNRSGPCFFASTGDSQYVEYPSCSPFVVAAGGTSVATDSFGVLTAESGWIDGGGGNSLYEPKPVWQDGVTMTGSGRGVPDLSSDADPKTGVSVYDSTAYEGTVYGWFVIGGTSVSSPCLAGMENASGELFVSTTQLLTVLYGNYLETPNPFRDITTGGNTFLAQAGWDYATGVGAPLGARSFTPASPNLISASISSPGSTVTVASGATVPFAGSATDSSTGATLSYAWNFGDGSVGNGTPTSHVFTNLGIANATRSVTLEVADGTGASATATRTVIVTPAPAGGSLVANTPTPLYGASVTLTPTFNGGTGVIGSSGLGSTDIAASATSGVGVPTPAVTAARTYTLTVTPSSGSPVSVSCTVTPQAVTMAAVVPATANLAVGFTQSFVCGVTGAANGTVIWSVDGIAGGNASVGTLSPAGLYTAGTSLGLHTITATATANGATQTATVTVSADQVAMTAVTPATANLTVGYSQLFTCTVTGAPNPTVNWSVDGIAGGSASIGTVSAAGLYTAGTSLGPHTITATAAANGATRTATVTVYAAPVAVSLVAMANPINAGTATTLTPTFSGGTATLGTNGPGSSDLTTQATSGQGIGTGSVNTTTTYTLTVSNGFGGQATATCTVTVDAFTITVPIPAVGLLTGSSTTFLARVTGAGDGSVIWTTTPGGTITPGTPSASATFTSAVPGTYTVTATGAADPAQTATVTVQVHGGNFLDAAVSGLDVLDLVGNFSTVDPAVALTGDGVVNMPDLDLLLQLLGW